MWEKRAVVAGKSWCMRAVTRKQLYDSLSFALGVKSLILILTSDPGNGGEREIDEAEGKVKVTIKNILSAKPRTKSTSAPRTVAKLTQLFMFLQFSRCVSYYSAFLHQYCTQSLRRSVGADNEVFCHVWYLKDRCTS